MLLAFTRTGKFACYANWMETKRSRGRPVTTGTPPVRTTRQGDVWDQADALAKARGETIHKVITRALEAYLQENGE